MTSESNVWIGAWWIGFVASAVVCFIIAIPILAFPSALPGKYIKKNKTIYSFFNFIKLYFF